MLLFMHLLTTRKNQMSMNYTFPQNCEQMSKSAIIINIIFSLINYAKV